MLHQQGAQIIPDLIGIQGHILHIPNAYKTCIMKKYPVMKTTATPKFTFHQTVMKL